MPVFVLGLSVIRGSPVPVVDARLLLLTGAGPSPAERFVIAKVGERRVAIAVDEVVGVRVIPPSSLKALPPLLGDASAEVIAAIGVLDRELLIVLEGARLVPDAAWTLATEGAEA